jgi:CBS domain containing-hemolysin-like protein
MLFHRLGTHPVWFALIYSLSLVVFYAALDLLPKMLFRSFPTRLCIYLARPFRFVHLLLRPLVAIVETISDSLLKWRGGKVFTGRLFGNREELRMLMQESGQGLTTEERAMINRVLDLQSLTVRQAMVPLAHAVVVNASDPVSRALELCREKKLTRLPVLGERDGQQRVIGLISLERLLFGGLIPTRPIGDHLRPALFLEEDLRLELALRRMQRSGQRLAIVLGRDQREIGILSLEDILKVIFGEVRL